MCGSTGLAVHLDHMACITADLDKILDTAIPEYILRKTWLLASPYIKAETLCLRRSQETEIHVFQDFEVQDPHSQLIQDPSIPRMGQVIPLFLQMKIPTRPGSDRAVQDSALEEIQDISLRETDITAHIFLQTETLKQICMQVKNLLMVEFPHLHLEVRFHLSQILKISLVNDRGEIQNGGRLQKRWAAACDFHFSMPELMPG